MSAKYLSAVYIIRVEIVTVKIMQEIQSSCLLKAFVTIAESLLFGFKQSISSDILYTSVTRNGLCIFYSPSAARISCPIHYLQSMHRHETQTGKDVIMAEYQIHRNKQQKAL